MQEKLLRVILTALLKLLFRVRVRGLEHFRASGDKVLVIANHQSFLDPLLLAVLLPEKPAFAMNLFQAQKWYFRWCEKIVTVYKLDPSQPMSMKALLSNVKKGGRLVLFPEGRITTTGGIMKMYDGAAMIANKTGATILPVHIDGAQYSVFSKLKGKMPQRWRPRITLPFFPPVWPDANKPLHSRDIYDLMTYHAFEASSRNRPLLSALLDARALHGSSKVIASDISRAELTYRALFTRGFVLSSRLSPYLEGQRYVAMLLPNALAAMVTFTSLHMLGKVPCMLNFSSGESNVVNACKIACIRTILTSRTFVEKGNLQSLVAALSREHVVIYLEDIRESISTADKLMAALKGLLPAAFLSRVVASQRPYDPAVVLYTSGSEGTPKGVALSHANILANIYQSLSRLDLNASDRLFNALPVFHSFGLTIGMILPMLRGIFVFLYPTPLHFRVIPEMIYDTDSTIMVGTDTFFQGYAHYAGSYDFRSIRLAVAGAEKLRDSTRALYADRFGVSIMQGYGVTETSPVLSCNTALYQKRGSVGRFFPGIEWRVEPVPGMERGGRLWVKGPNVMLGYLKLDQPGIIQPHGEWYDTGDIVEVDAESFITILGRAKRFAKIAGEMVSLGALEDYAAQLMPGVTHAAVAVPDDRKGEQIILVSESADMTRQLLLASARQAGIAELCLPKQVIYMSEVPRLGSGKINYPELTQRVLLGEL